MLRAFSNASTKLNFRVRWHVHPCTGEFATHLAIADNGAVVVDVDSTNKTELCFLDFDHDFP